MKRYSWTIILNMYHQYEEVQTEEFLIFLNLKMVSLAL